MEVIKIQILLMKIKFNIYYEKKPSSSGTSGLRKIFLKSFHEFGLIEGSRVNGHMENYYENLFSKIYDFFF